MYKSLLIFVLFILGVSTNAQFVNSYSEKISKSTSVKPGAFAFESIPSQIILKGTLNAVSESSGLVYIDGWLWTHQDSGNGPDIYAIDTIAASVLKTVQIDNYPNTDWEDITADSDYIYVGDFGNNLGTRTDLKILKIAKKDIGNQETIHVNAEAIQFSYTDQQTYTDDNKTNFDCEALISFKDSLFIFTKDHRDYKTRIYGLPKLPGTYKINPLSEYNIGGLVTGADYDPVSGKIILIGYDGSKLNSFLCTLSGFKDTQFFSGTVTKTKIGNNTEWQTEGVCYADSVHVFISCESTAGIIASLYSCNLRQATITGSPEITNTNISCYPNPADDYLNIYSPVNIKSIEVWNLNGKKVFHIDLNSSQYQLQLNEAGIKQGVYLLEIKTADKTVRKQVLVR